MGAVGLSLGMGRFHLPCPLAPSTLLSAREHLRQQVSRLKLCSLSQALRLCMCGALTDPLPVRSKRCGSSLASLREKARWQQRCGKQSHLWPREDGLIPLGPWVTQLGTYCSRRPQLQSCLLPLQVTALRLFCCLSHCHLLCEGSQVNSYDELD